MELPVKTRIPIPLEIVECITIWSLMKAFVTDTDLAHLWIPFGICVKVLFEFLARPGEVHSLR
jgi:hypothetical protein